MSNDLVQNFATMALDRSRELQADDPDIASAMPLLAGQLAAGDAEIGADAIEALRAHNKALGFTIDDDLFDRAKAELIACIPTQG